MSRQVLVTGGAGFIGSHVVEAVLHAGDRVRVVDDLSSGSLDNLTDCVDDVEVLVGDVRDADLVARALRGSDAVVHLAAVVSVDRSFKEPELVHEVNVSGSLTTLLAARRSGVGRFVFASSASVYGDAEDVPVAEESPLRPLSPYAVGKAAVEGYGRALATAQGPSVAALRFFNVYGPRQDPASDYAGVIARFLDCAAQGQPYTVYGDGGQTRDFVYVGDVAQAAVLALNADAPPPFAALNIAGGRELSILDLAKAVHDAVGGPRDEAPPFRMRTAPARSGDIRRSCALTERAQTMLGFTPHVALADGLAATWQWRRRQDA